MPLSTLDPKAALIIIDLQKGVIGMPTAHPINEIVRRAAQLAQAFRERQLPVVLVNVTGRAPGRTNAGMPKFSPPPDWTDFAPELNQAPTDYVVSKQRPGAFIGTSLDHHLRQLGVTQVFLAGVATSIGVESTGRSAYDLGYNVVFVVDAMADRDPATHCHSVEKIFPRLGETASTKDVLQALAEK